LELGLAVDSGLHVFLGDDPEFNQAATKTGVLIRDVRKPPDKQDLHFFSGKILEVTSYRLAVLGTDSAIGKRTTAWAVVHGLRAAGFSAELIGTGQTAWMQGARFGARIDALVYDYVGGEIEHAAWSAWKELAPDVLVIEGQGGLMSPGYPGGLEILNAFRPDSIILQHAPCRRFYEDYPDFEIQPLETQIAALEILSGKTVTAVTLNSQGMSQDAAAQECRRLADSVHRQVYEVLLQGVDGLVASLKPSVLACRLARTNSVVLHGTVPSKQA